MVDNSQMRNKRMTYKFQTREFFNMMKKVTQFIFLEVNSICMKMILVFYKKYIIMRDSVTLKQNKSKNLIRQIIKLEK